MVTPSFERCCLVTTNLNGLLVTSSLIDLCHPVTMSSEGVVVTSPSPLSSGFCFSKPRSQIVVYIAQLDTKDLQSVQMKSNTRWNPRGADGQWFTPQNILAGWVGRWGLLSGCLGDACKLRRRRKRRRRKRTQMGRYRLCAIKPNRTTQPAPLREAVIKGYCGSQCSFFSAADV